MRLHDERGRNLIARTRPQIRVPFSVKQLRQSVDIKPQISGASTRSIVA
jgi:hypothetical protein